MAHAYRSLEPGAQIVITDEPREDLEAMARWETIDPAEAKTLIAKTEKGLGIKVAAPDVPTDDEQGAADDALDIDAAPAKTTKSRGK